ncbi:GyrI-like domain-containing protein [Algoriphagus sp. NG3]|uniref:GyrI-like domain-containing protein n=1 Tax=Algoriphagus sp. NG3 TaxID=3097546 RepID=UPI002A7F1C22|nr:GyrI-like domain-containing protein [Algoriphagus sp. NG3]WPR77149.1 GyrI-like domain-containing protein [Algoriphagus sp. NG3]
MNSLKLPEFTLMGIMLPETTNENEQAMKDCGALWQRFEKESIYSQIPDKISDEVYAVYYAYQGDHTQPYSYFIGCKVADTAETPSGLHKIQIPEDTYLKNTASGKMPDCVANAWREIWKSDLDRAYHYDFEVYDQRSQNWEAAEVDIFLSMKQIDY